MSKEIEEMRAHKAEMAKEIQYTNEVFAHVERFLRESGAMFMVVVGDKKGVNFRTACFGATGGYGRMLATLSDSASNVLHQEIERLKRELKARDGEETWED